MQRLSACVHAQAGRALRRQALEHKTSRRNTRIVDSLYMLPIFNIRRSVIFHSFCAFCAICGY